MRKIITILSLSLILTCPALVQAGKSGVIVIDPGHGGYETGLSGQGQIEKDATLSISKAISDLLSGKKKVHLTRQVDNYLSLSDRVKAASSRKPGIFLSIHTTDSDEFTVCVSAYDENIELSLKRYYAIESRQRTHIYNSRVLAGNIEQSLKDIAGVQVVHRELPLLVLSGMSAPAVLIEIPISGFNTSEKLQQTAEAIVSGIEAYEKR